MSLFDIVIPVGPNDIEMIQTSVKYTKLNIIGYRNIYLISSFDKLCVENCQIIYENIFPFNINDIDNILGKSNRNGWYLQQLLKIYAGNIIPGILDRYLVIDADTCFLKPTCFITNDNKCIYTTGIEYHEPYFFHMNRLHPTLKKVHPLSGISHHTIFETKIINNLFNMVENFHNNGNLFWKIFLENINPYHHNYSASAENEIYFTYIFLYNNNNILIRKLKWANVSNIDDNLDKDLDFISVHYYMRPLTT
jgi:hypothetical protein